MGGHHAATISTNISAFLWHLERNKGKQKVSTKKLVDSTQSTQSLITDVCNLHQHRCYNPKISGKPSVCRTAATVTTYSVLSGLK